MECVSCQINGDCVASVPPAHKHKQKDTYTDKENIEKERTRMKTSIKKALTRKIWKEKIQKLNIEKETMKI